VGVGNLTGSSCVHLFLCAAGTSDHRQSSHVGDTARLCAFVSGLWLSAVPAHIWLSHGSPFQFSIICSVDQLWLHQSTRGQSGDHPLLVWGVVKLSRGEDRRFQRSGGTVRPIFGAFSGWGVGNPTGSSCVLLFLCAAGTSGHRQSSHVGDTARLCAFVSGLWLSAVPAHIWLSHGSPFQFSTICSVDQLWLHQSTRGQSSDHPLLVWGVVKLSRGEDRRF
jgi:hypothetical protein